MESNIQLTIEIRNRSSTDKESEIQFLPSPEFTARNPECQTAWINGSLYPDLNSTSD